MCMLQPRIYVSLLVDKAEIESAKFYFDLRASTGADNRRNKKALQDEKASKRLFKNLKQFNNADR